MLHDSTVHTLHPLLLVCIFPAVKSWNAVEIANLDGFLTVILEGLDPGPARAFSDVHLLVAAARSHTRSPSVEHTVLDGLHSGFGPGSAVGRLPLGICVHRDSTWLLDS